MPPSLPSDSHWFVRGENYTVSSLFCKNGRMYVLLPDKDTDLWQLLASVENLEGVFKEPQKNLCQSKTKWQSEAYGFSDSDKENETHSHSLVPITPRSHIPTNLKLDLPVDSKEGQVFSLINTVYYYDEWLDKFHIPTNLKSPAVSVRRLPPPLQTWQNTN